jgi:hypothetical protein
MVTAIHGVKWDPRVEPTAKVRHSVPYETSGVSLLEPMSHYVREMSGSSVSFTTRSEVESLKSVYNFPTNDDGIFSILQPHPVLVGLLFDAAMQLHAYFPNAHLRLEVDDEPDDFQNRQLVVAVRVSSGIEASLATLKDFDKEWWLSNLARAEGLLTIDVEF